MSGDPCVPGHRDFLSEPRPKLVLFPFMPELLHLPAHLCICRPLCMSLAPGLCVGGQPGGGAQQALVSGLNSLVKQLRHCQRRGVCPGRKGGPQRGRGPGEGCAGEIKATFLSSLEPSFSLLFPWARTREGQTWRPPLGADAGPALCQSIPR